jgi:HEAT repeat protein
MFKYSYCFKKSYSDDVSQAAYKLLKQIGEPAVSSLANLIVEEEDKVEYQIHAIWLLKDIGPDVANVAVPKLIQALRNKASKVRIAAAEALIDFRPVAKVTIPKLIVGLADRDIDVRKAMVACLVEAEPAILDLLPLLADENAIAMHSLKLFLNLTHLLENKIPMMIVGLLSKRCHFC